MVVLVAMIVFMLTSTFMNSSLMVTPILALCLSVCVILSVSMVDYDLMALGFEMEKVSWLMIFLLGVSMMLSLSTGVFGGSILKTKSILLLGLICVMFFSTGSLLAFFVAFESSLIPIYYMIMSHGMQPERISASNNIIMFTTISSVPLFMVLINLSMGYGVWVFSILDMYRSSLSNLVMGWLVLGFLVKLPMYGFHIWLPMAHVEAPLEGSMVLASILLKLGGFGIYRFSAQLTSVYFSSEFCLVWGFLLIGALIGGFMALFSMDVKVVVAYSSVSHMNFMMLALLSMKELSVKALVVTSISHALSSSALFFLVTILYNMGGSRNIMFLKGISSIIPALQMLSFMICSMNLSSPPFLSFLGEMSSIFSIIFLTPSSFLGLLMMVMVSSVYSMNLFGISSLSKNNLESFPENSFLKLVELLFISILSVELFFTSSFLDPIP